MRGRYNIIADRMHRTFDDDSIITAIEDFDWLLRMGDERKASELGINILPKILAKIETGDNLPNIYHEIPKTQWEKDNKIWLIQLSIYFGKVHTILSKRHSGVMNID